MPTLFLGGEGLGRNQMDQTGGNVGGGELSVTRRERHQTFRWLRIHIQSMKGKIGMAKGGQVVAIDTSELIASWRVEFVWLIDHSW